MIQSLNYSVSELKENVRRRIYTGSEAQGA